MAKDSTNDLTWFLRVEKRYREDLAGIRHLSDLKAGFDENQIWVKDFSYAQINSTEVKSIPFKSIFYAKGGKLFLQNSLLPDRNIPSLLWSPIDRALPLEMPSFNHNFFGIEEKIIMNLLPSEVETEAVGMLTSTEDLHKYLEAAPAIRLKNTNWVILENHRVFLLGKPFLPIKGATFWKRGEFLIPTGFDFDLFSLTDSLNNSINPTGEFWVVWNVDGTYFLISKKAFRGLSLGAFRESVGSNLE